ncbi:hypothetical protein GDO81_028265 [Engystomops pustulosus]|uniref:Secreted protein n=1 Tax=Engystomops pustulosus TaxID=76066 RepID=A0AAV6ZGU2_ENGPU|nr:hypothetical protein GDO81_028265 [Engystomops pustulosus]
MTMCSLQGSPPTCMILSSRLCTGISSSSALSADAPPGASCGTAAISAPVCRCKAPLAGGVGAEFVLLCLASFSNPRGS